MRILVIMGIDAQKKHIDYERIGDATQERVGINNLPQGGEGWAFYNIENQPDYSWPDYTIAVGTVEVGRHEISEHIIASEDIESHLISTYDRLNEEIGDEGSSE